MLDTSPFVAVAAAVGALGAAVAAVSHPKVALGILFLLASWSRATLETPVGTMRMEMPAVALVAITLLARRSLPVANLPRSAIGAVIGFGVYAGVLAFSSATIAPGTAQSLRMVAWLGISMLGGVVAFALVRPSPQDAAKPFAFGGAAMGVAGLAAATAFLILGPTFHAGIQDPASSLPRVYALSWETNLYASFLAMSAFLALEAARDPGARFGWPMLAVVLIAFPLGVTRGAYAGLAAGAIAYLAVRSRERPIALSRIGIASVGFLAIGVLASNALLPNALERQGGNLTAGAPSSTPNPNSSGLVRAPSPSPTTMASATPAGPSGSPVGTASATPSASSSAAPNPTASGPLAPSSGSVHSIAPEPDTLAFRLERVPIALNDLWKSPLVGFGAESFGQRHPDRYAGAGPDHIAILAVVAPYESGLVGAAGLVAGFALLLRALYQAARGFAARGDMRSFGIAAAYIGSLVSILVAYQVTNALHLAVNWLIIGAALALTARNEDLRQVSQADR